MAITVRCPECGKRLQAPDSAAGKRAKCPNCSKVLVIPEPVYEAEEFAEEPAPVPAPTPTPTPAAPRDLSDLLDEADEYPLQAPPPTLPTSTPSSAGVDTRRPCPMCGEFIPPGAAVCRFCGEIFDPTLKRKKKKSWGWGSGGGGEDEDLNGVDIALAILCTNIGCILGVIWMIQGKPKGGKMVGLCLLMQVIGFFIGMVMSAMGGGGP